MFSGELTRSVSEIMTNHTADTFSMTQTIPRHPERFWGVSFEEK
jgi:hypothetical protein